MPWGRLFTHSIRFDDFRLRVSFTSIRDDSIQFSVQFLSPWVNRAVVACGANNRGGGTQRIEQIRRLELDRRIELY